VAGAAVNAVVLKPNSVGVTLETAVSVAVARLALASVVAAKTRGVRKDRKIMRAATLETRANFNCITE